MYLALISILLTYYSFSMHDQHFSNHPEDNSPEIIMHSQDRKKTWRVIEEDGFTIISPNEEHLIQNLNSEDINEQNTIQQDQIHTNQIMNNLPQDFVQKCILKEETKSIIDAYKKAVEMDMQKILSINNQNDQEEIKQTIDLKVTQSQVPQQKQCTDEPNANNQLMLYNPSLNFNEIAVAQKNKINLQAEQPIISNIINEAVTQKLADQEPSQKKPQKMGYLQTFFSMNPNTKKNSTPQKSNKKNNIKEEQQKKVKQEEESKKTKNTKQQKKKKK